MALQVELVSPERILWSGEAEMVVARTSDGDIAFLTGHSPFIGALGIGAVVVADTAERYVYRRGTLGVVLSTDTPATVAVTVGCGHAPKGSGQ